MTRIADFNIMNQRHRANTSAECKVYINNQSNSNIPLAETQTRCAEPKYHSPITEEQQVIVNQNAEQPKDVEKELFRAVAIAYGNILHGNNKALLSNILDLSGKVVIPIIDLVHIIALAVGKKDEDISISYLTSAKPGCCLNKSVEPIKQIQTIYVGNIELNFFNNSVKGYLMNTFQLSLDRVYVAKELENENV
jgi:hypothetical protein